MNFINRLRNWYDNYRLKNKFENAIRYIYSFDNIKGATVEDIINKLTPKDSTFDKLETAILIRFVLALKEPFTKTDLDKFNLEHFKAMKYALQIDSFKLVYDIEKAKTEMEYIKFQVDIEFLQHSYKNDENSLDGLKYKWMQHGKGPLSKERIEYITNYYNKMASLNKRIDELVKERVKQ